MLDTDNPKTEEDLDAWLNSIQSDEKEYLTKQTGEISPVEKTIDRVEPLKNATPLKEYIARMKQSSTLPSNSFLGLQGLQRDSSDEISQKTKELLAFNLLPEHYQKYSGGFYFRAANKGFVVNPGPNFLEKLHESGLHINSIDFVIVSSPLADSYSEAKAIYDLNYKCNLQSDSLHIIQYFLHQTAYKNLFASLKPHFKQEKDSVKCLELYMDSPDVETVALSNEVTLSYFSLGRGKENLGISFSIKGQDHSKDLSLAFVCLEGLEVKDIQKLAAFDLMVCSVLDPFNNQSQLSLMKECLEKQPQKNSLLLFQDMAKSEIDSRIEVAKYVRESLSAKVKLNKTVLPIDCGLLIDIAHLSLRCTSCSDFANAADIRVTKSKKAFGQLNYLCPECFL